MHLIQLLLPLYDNDGQPLPSALFREVKQELTDRFGGLTAYSRAPAEGQWREDTNRTIRDDIVVFEVMAEALNRDWWRAYRARLERRFTQQQVIIRASVIEML